METPVTPRMILGMNAASIACMVVSFERAAFLEPVNELGYLPLATATASVLRQMIGTDEAERMILEQRVMLENCIALLNDPDQLGRDADAWLKTQTR